MTTKSLVTTHATRVVAALLIAGACLGVGSQTPTAKSANPVTLSGAPASMKEIAEKIQEQTGLTVKLAAPLSERKLSIACRMRPLKSLLDAICELEGWKWSASQDGKVLTVEPEAVGMRPGESRYAAIRRATPPDLAAFLRMGPPSDIGHGSTEAANRLREPQMMLQQRLVTALKPYAKEIRENGLRLSSVKPEDQELLFLGVVVSRWGVRSLSEFLGNSDWLTADPAGSRIRLDRNVLLIDCRLGEGLGVSSFGTTIQVPD